MKGSVIKIDVVKDCVYTVKINNDKRSGVDGLNSIRRLLKLNRSHKTTPQMFHLNMSFDSFDIFKPVMFIDDGIKDKFDDDTKLRSWNTLLPMMNITSVCQEIQRADVYIFGNVIICLRDIRTGELVGLNNKQIKDILSVLTRM